MVSTPFELKGFPDPSMMLVCTICNCFNELVTGLDRYFPSFGSTKHKAKQGESREENKKFTRLVHIERDGIS